MILTTTRAPAPVLMRIERRSEQVGECFVWRGATDHEGYGSILGANGRTGSVHVIAYRLMVGGIPNGLVLDHLECRERCCWNPWHLDPVPMAVNTRRSNADRWAKHSFCKRGHAWEGDNIMVVRNGKRRCRECHRMRDRGEI